MRFFDTAPSTFRKALPQSAGPRIGRRISFAGVTLLLLLPLTACSEPKWGSVSSSCELDKIEVRTSVDTCVFPAASASEGTSTPTIAPSSAATGARTGKGNKQPKFASVVEPDGDETGSTPDETSESSSKALAKTNALVSIGGTGPTSGRIDFSLPSAASVAVIDHPEVKIQKARIDETNAGVGIAISGLYPSGTASIGTGASMNATGVGTQGPFQGAVKGNDGRLDGGITLRQLIYDFGATQLDVERAKLSNEAERLKTFEKLDDISFRTTQAYLKVLESRDLLKLVDETLAAHRGLAEIVQANVKEGNGTNADVSRIASRINDLGAIRSDLSLQMLSAQEDLRRFTRREPGRLVTPVSYRRAIPLTPDDAIASARRESPRLRSVDASTGAIQKEIEFQKAAAYPKLSVEIGGDTKNYQRPGHYNNEAEGRALLSLQYKFADGGLNEATVSQLIARREGSALTYQNEREQMEADIRQAYRAIVSADLKSRLVRQGVMTAAKVQELYVEQFKANRRTVFEVLDSQMSSYTSRRTLIESQYDLQRAVFSILKLTGKLTLTLTTVADLGSKTKADVPQQNRAPLQNY